MGKDARDVALTAQIAHQVSVTWVGEDSAGVELNLGREETLKRGPILTIQ